MFAIWLCVFLCTIQPGEGNANALKYKKQWAGCSSEEPFLILRNIAMDKCVSECNIRTACLAVNYWTRRLQCDMFFNDTDSPLQDGNNTQPCVFVKKADFDPAYNRSLENCTECNGTTACDISSGHCEIRECRQLLVPNATIKGNMLSVGSKIRIYCNSSFAQHPNETLSICQPNGNWSRVPTCQYLFACAEPPTIANATMIMGTRAVGDVINYTCNAGFSDPHADLTVVGNNNSKKSIQCQENGTWTYSDFQCVADCDEPPVVDNSAVSTGAIMQGSVRNYSCHEGYSTINNASMTMTCQQGGTWTTVAFKCVQDCDEPPIIDNAAVSPGAIMHSSERSYTCNEGFSDINNSSMRVTCQQDATWTDVVFECVQDCDEPPGVDNATITSGAIVQGSVRSYTCNAGYSDVNNALMTVTCQQGGTWTKAKFECVQDCDDPPYVVNANVTSGATMQGSVRWYTCNDGYSNIHNALMTVACQQGGTWTKVKFECVQDCDKPPDVVNANVTSGEVMQGSVRWYTCNEGYSNIHNALMTVACTQGGTWTRVKFECAQASVCPPDEDSFHQGVLPDGTLFQFRAFSDAVVDFYEAMAKCEAEGGRLYQILTLEKMNFTLQLMACPAYQPYGFWIDAVFNQTTNWYDTTTGTPLPTTLDFWYPGEPNEYGMMECVYLKTGYGHRWCDRGCAVSDYHTYALCEIF